MYINVAHIFGTILVSPYSAGGAGIYLPVATKMQRFINESVFTTSKE
jgi:hypothetical protein